MPQRIIGAEKESIQGPGTIVHEGGDGLLIAPVEGGLPGTEQTLFFEGNEVVVEGDDEFHPASAEARSFQVEGTVLVRALGQANITWNEPVDVVAEVEDEIVEAEIVEDKPKAKKKAPKKKALNAA